MNKLTLLVGSLSKTLYPYCLVLVGSRNGFERDFTIELKWNEGLMEDWLKCQIISLVKYRQNPNTCYSIYSLQQFSNKTKKQKTISIKQPENAVSLIKTLCNND